MKKLMKMTQEIHEKMQTDQNKNILHSESESEEQKAQDGNTLAYDALSIKLVQKESDFN